MTEQKKQKKQNKQENSHTQTNQRKQKHAKQRKNRSCLGAFILGIVEFILIMVLLPILFMGWMNGSMIVSTHGNQVTLEEAKEMEPVDMIVVLGASVHGNEPSDILKDRLNQAIKLYKKGVSDTILMTGDGTSSEYYNEVRAMKNYAVKKGVPKSAIKTDRNGLSTYESMYNIVEKYGRPSVMIVTQKYHLSRAMYIAKKMGMTVYGCSAQQKLYKDTSAESKREILARCKDYLILLLEKVVEE